MRRVFAAFAAIGFGTDPVHRDVQKLVRLGRKRAKAHARRHEPLADRGDAFHLFNRHRLAQRLDVEKVAQVNWRVRPHHRRILLPEVETALFAGGLQQVHAWRFPSVFFARAARLVKAAHRQHVLPAQPAAGVHLFELALDAVQANAGNAALHAGEVFGHHRAAKAHRLEVKAAAIARNHRNAHLRHDLEQPGVDCRAVAAHRFDQTAFDQTPLTPVGNGILRKIGVYRGGAAADQHGNIVRVNAFCRTHVDAGEGAQALAGQPAMHRAGGQNHRHRRLLGALMFIGQNQVVCPRAHGVFGLGADARQPALQRILPGARGKGTVDSRNIRPENLPHRVKFGIEHQRAFQQQNLGLAAVFVEHVLEVAEPRFQAHHPAFAQAVDWWIGDLAEVLPEKMAQRAICF